MKLYKIIFNDGKEVIKSGPTFFYKKHFKKMKNVKSILKLDMNEVSLLLRDTYEQLREAINTVFIMSDKLEKLEEENDKLRNVLTKYLVDEKRENISKTRSMIFEEIKEMLNEKK